MKKETWKMVINMLISVLTAIATTLAHPIYLGGSFLIL